MHDMLPPQCALLGEAESRIVFVPSAKWMGWVVFDLLVAKGKRQSSLRSSMALQKVELL